MFLCPRACPSLKQTCCEEGLHPSEHVVVQSPEGRGARNWFCVRCCEAKLASPTTTTSQQLALISGLESVVETAGESPASGPVLTAGLGLVVRALARGEASGPARNRRRSNGGGDGSRARLASPRRA